jgi:FixJ family two-component response regulator
MAEASPWIAIVDDDPAVLKALSRLLRSRAFRTHTYRSGEEFLAALPAGLRLCLIVDLQMPEMNGMELQHHLISKGIRIPSILITAHADAVMPEASDERTFVASLRKPLQEEALFLAIEMAIGSSGNGS